MHESRYSGGMVNHLREHLGGAVVLKHSDQLTGGIPDSSVSWCGQTFWLEVKREGNEARGLQSVTLRRLSAATGRAFYVVYSRTDVKIVHPLTYEVIFYGAGHGNHGVVEQFIRNHKDYIRAKA